MTRINIRDYLHFQEDTIDDCRFTEDEKDEILEAFILFDKDRDGLISIEELGKVIRSLGQALTVGEETDIVAQFAQEKCNEIDFIAFYKLFKKMRKKFDEDEELREAFRKFDEEDKKYVQVEDLKNMLLTIGEPLTKEEVNEWLKDGEQFIKYYSQTSESSFSEENKDNLEDEEGYEPTEEEQRNLCKAFTLLDIDGDGVIEHPDLKNLLISWGRMPMDEDLDNILSYAQDKGCEGAIGMNFNSFQRYIKNQLVDTTDEEILRKAFEIFDSDPPTGKLNVKELRHFLKHKGDKLNDDELDFLFKEEDYWMLEENNIFEYEKLIDKILDKPSCNSPFLHC